METELRQFSLSTGEDILLAHELAMHLARRAGAGPTDQINFAARVAQQCTIGGYIAFSIEEKEKDRYLLKVISSNHPASIVKEVPRKIDSSDLVVIYDNIWKGRDELERSYRDMQQFTFALSHDLKNSLAKLKLAVSLVQEEPMPATVHNYLDIIHRAANRLEHTMRSLNEIIKLGHAEPRIISPAGIFEDVREEFTETLYDINATLTVNFSPVNEMNYIETYLRSIFSNVVSNAIKYAEPGRPLHLMVTGFKKDKYGIFTFTDNGLGIDLQMHRDKLFLPFTRFSGHSEGSGIGLYLIKNMVESNGGRIEVESIPGTGTTFTFYLREY
jgi:signal transduction histidine kinase